jgi:hypothetical protein
MDPGCVRKISRERKISFLKEEREEDKRREKKMRVNFYFYNSHDIYL